MMPSSLQSIGQQTNKTTKMHKERIILGIDPGTNVMGYGILRVLDTKASMVAMGVIDLRPLHDPYLKLGRIFERVTGIIDEFLPDEMAIEAPFFGKNVQSMLKLGRAQGVAIAAAIHHDIPIHEYAPLKIKMAITGLGQASKEQVAACRSDCYISIRRRCRNSWMPPTLSVRLTATTYNCLVLTRVNATMAHGRNS